MMNTMKRWMCGVVAMAALLLPGGAHAQGDSLNVGRYYMRCVQYGAGYANVYDTYLSPQEYKGVDFKVMRETMRMTNWADGRISLQNLFQADLNYTHNRADNNNELGGTANLNYALHYHLPLAQNFRLLVGGAADMNLGFIYNMRNGNNPASARAYVNLDASAMAIWSTHIKRYPLTLRGQVNLPLAGVMFSPHYGQSYYEIFTLGNSSGVVRFTSLHNQPSLRYLFSVDLPMGSAKMRLSYVGDLQQADVNEIRSHIYSHAFMVGFVRSLYRLDTRRTSSYPSTEMKLY
jgi:hypothetical protein